MALIQQMIVCWFKLHQDNDADELLTGKPRFFKSLLFEVLSESLTYLSRSSTRRRLQA